MICLRCGYCCKHSAVIIVDDPEKGIVNGNLIPHGMDGKVSACKHLVGELPGEFECAIHHYDWYVDTPCFDHNDDGRDEDCRMGRHILGRLFNST